MELIGIPMRVVLSEKGLAKGVAEFKGRSDESASEIDADNIVEFIKSKLA
jgi:prolyl-tRNA synthetase